jgi:hypothetical protein
MKTLMKFSGLALVATLAHPSTAEAQLSGGASEGFQHYEVWQDGSLAGHFVVAEAGATNLPPGYAAGTEYDFGGWDWDESFELRPTSAAAPPISDPHDTYDHETFGDTLDDFPSITVGANDGFWLVSRMVNGQELDEGWIWIHGSTQEAWSLVDRDTFPLDDLIFTPVNPPPTTTQVYTAGE